MSIAVIMAGGKGTRLASITGDEIPKPMVPIAGKPILLRQLETLYSGGVKEFIFIVGHLHEKIMEFFGDGSKFGVSVSYIVESEPLGSAGALFYLKNRLKDDFFLVFGDTIFDIDLDRMLDFHHARRAAITLLAHPNSHPYDSDLVVTDPDGKVTAILDKNVKRDFDYLNLVNAAFFIVSPRALEVLSSPLKLDMEKGLIANRIKEYNDVYAYTTTEYIKDAGTVDRLESVERDIVNGTVHSRNLSLKQRCIFLDRDGTINKFVGFLRSPDQVELLPRAAEAIAKINASKYLAVIVSNQPVIARGEVDESGMLKIRRRLETLLGNHGAYIDAVYYCPHHPDKGFEGEVVELKIDCDCRKPKPGLLLKAAKELNVDLSESWTVGDSWRDVGAGIAAGTHTIRLTCGEPFKDGPEAELICSDLYQAVDQILRRKE